LQKYAVRNNMQIPDLPPVSKVDVRAGLWEADMDIGERACIYAQQCMSFKMCETRIQENPEKYARVTPFVCKEFYYGDKAKEIKEAMAKGIPLNEVYGPRLTMCILCHLATVRKFYIEYDLHLANAPVHVLHAFQFQIGIPGEYPLERMLMGDETYKGIIAPFLRFCEDLYTWQPALPDPAKVRTPAQNAKVLQHWDETACLDF